MWVGRYSSIWKIKREYKRGRISTWIRRSGILMEKREDKNGKSRSPEAKRQVHGDTCIDEKGHDDER